VDFPNFDKPIKSLKFATLILMAKSTESIEEFYKHKFANLSENLKKDIGQFNVFRIEEQIKAGRTSPTFIRRDFFKIMLFEGNNVFHYGDRSIEVKGNTLLLHLRSAKSRNKGIFLCVQE
jgi:hypothetical protein